VSGFPDLAGLGRPGLEGRRFGLQPLQLLFLQLDCDFQVERRKQDGFPAGPGSPVNKALPRVAGQRLPVGLRRGYLQDGDRPPGAMPLKHTPASFGRECDENHQGFADDPNGYERGGNKDQSKDEIHGFLLSLKREEKRAPRGAVTPRAGW
jgi:hypothetical protein